MDFTLYCLANLTALLQITLGLLDDEGTPDLGLTITEPGSYFWLTLTCEKQQAPGGDRGTACWPTRSFAEGSHSLSTKGKRAQRAVPRACRKPSPGLCTEMTLSQASKGSQRLFTAVQLEQTNFSYLNQAQGQSNNRLRATCSRWGDTSTGGLTPQPSSIDQSCTGVILTIPVRTMWPYTFQPCISDPIQVISFSVENVETHCQSGTPLGYSVRSC